MSIRPLFFIQIITCFGRLLFGSLWMACLILTNTNTIHAQTTLKAKLVEQGRELFNNETFSGNGRTCSTCHRPKNNYTLDSAFIKTLPASDPLFIAEFSPQLSKGFENPKLMRQFGLILTNPDGFDNLEDNFAMRAVPHLQGIKTTIDSVNGPMLGLGGDSGPLRTFANGAIKQHMTKSLARMEGIDYRLATAEELIALEAFMLTIGRQEEIKLPISLKGSIASRGQELYLDDKVGKCNICHINGGANGIVKGVPSGNVNFATGVEALIDNLAKLTGEKITLDDGFGRPGDGSFNGTPVIEAADTPPYMHNNSVMSLEGTVEFYNSDAFNNSKTGKFLASLDKNGIGIKLNVAQVDAISEFMRILNVLENIRAAESNLQMAMNPNPYQNRKQLMSDAKSDIDDAYQVMQQVYDTYPAIENLFEEVTERYDTATLLPFSFTIERIIKALQEVRRELISL